MLQFPVILFYLFKLMQISLPNFMHALSHSNTEVCYYCFNMTFFGKFVHLFPPTIGSYVFTFIPLQYVVHLKQTKNIIIVVPIHKTYPTNWFLMLEKWSFGSLDLGKTTKF